MPRVIRYYNILLRTVYSIHTNTGGTRLLYYYNIGHLH